MAIAVQQIYPVAHLPLVLVVLRCLAVATVIDRLLPPHPAHVLSCGRGVEALVLAILDGDHALYPYSATSQGTLKLPSVQRHCAIADPVPSSCHQREFDALGWDHGGLLLTIRMLDIPYTR
jgi:hypothetical protein